jgi:uncharacterized protein (TIGR00299 family) protein
VKQKVLSTIEIIAKTESKIHNVSLKDFHFHNYNDLIVELFGTYYILEKLSVEKIFSSPVKLNRGFVNCLHGKFPVPAPATLELVKNMPVEYVDCVPEDKQKKLSKSLNNNFETTTPTGVAILKVLSPEFLFPKMKILKVGYSAGEYDFDFPNILRLILGESVESFKDLRSLDNLNYNLNFLNKKDFYDYDVVLKIETNIDDLNPIFYEQLVEKLYSIGCLEVNLISTFNKKFRCGMLVTILLEKNLLEKVVKILFENTTTTGIRILEVQRIKLFRETKIVKTKYGKVKVKKIFLPNGEEELSPEYEDIKNLSLKTGVPIHRLYSKIFSQLNKE